MVPEPAQRNQRGQIRSFILTHFLRSIFFLTPLLTTSPQAHKSSLSRVSFPLPSFAPSGAVTARASPVQPWPSLAVSRAAQRTGRVAGASGRRQRLEPRLMPIWLQPLPRERDAGLFNL